jgi:hypothetical protein
MNSRCFKQAPYAFYGPFSVLKKKFREKQQPRVKRRKKGSHAARAC